MKTPGWWTGSWFAKSILIWLCGFLVWLPLFPRFPRFASLIFLVSMIPLVLIYGAARIGGWLRLIVVVYTAVAREKRGKT
jgi:hypothetical protein